MSCLRMIERRKIIPPVMEADALRMDYFLCK